MGLFQSGCGRRGAEMRVRGRRTEADCRRHGGRSGHSERCRPTGAHGDGSWPCLHVSAAADERRLPRQRLPRCSFLFSLPTDTHGSHHLSLSLSRFPVVSHDARHLPVRRCAPITNDISGRAHLEYRWTADGKKPCFSPQLVGDVYLPATPHDLS